MATLVSPNRNVWFMRRSSDCLTHVSVINGALWKLPKISWILTIAVLINVQIEYIDLEYSYTEYIDVEQVTTVLTFESM